MPRQHEQSSGSRVLTSGGDLGAAQRLCQLLLALNSLRGRGVAGGRDRRRDVAQAAGGLLHGCEVETSGESSEAGSLAT